MSASDKRNAFTVFWKFEHVLNKNPLQNIILVAQNAFFSTFYLLLLLANTQIVILVHRSKEKVNKRAKRLKRKGTESCA